MNVVLFNNVEHCFLSIPLQAITAKCLNSFCVISIGEYGFFILIISFFSEKYFIFINANNAICAIDSIIIDNGDPGTSSTGTWLTSSATDNYGSESLYSKQAGATYTFQASANGLYEVSLWWTQWASRDPSVPVSIYDGNTILDTVWIDQMQNQGQWNTIGSYEFSGTAKIVIESETTNYSTCADAIMFSQ